MKRCAEVVGISERTVERWRRESNGGEDRRRGPNTAPGNKLSQHEEQRLLREFDVRRVTDALRLLLFPGTDTALWDTALVPGTPLPTDPVANDVPSWPDAMQTAITRRPELREQRSRI